VQLLTVLVRPPSTARSSVRFTATALFPDGKRDDLHVDARECAHQPQGKPAVSDQRASRYSGHVSRASSRVASISSSGAGSDEHERGVDGFVSIRELVGSLLGGVASPPEAFSTCAELTVALPGHQAMNDRSPTVAPCQAAGAEDDRPRVDVVCFGEDRLRDRGAADSDA